MNLFTRLSELIIYTNEFVGIIFIFMYVSFGIKNTSFKIVDKMINVSICIKSL